MLSLLTTTMMLLLVPQVPPPVEGPVAEPNFTVGPLSVELVAMREIRLEISDQPDRSAAQSNFAMQIRVSGEKLKRMSRYGNLIIDEALTDNDVSLVDEKSFPEEMRTATRANTVPPERLSQTGLLLAAQTKLAPRAATTIAKLRGSVRLILADEARPITIDNPVQFYGKTIDNPQLKELGVEVSIVPVDQLEQSPPTGRTIALHYTAKEENVKQVTFVDGWMKAVPVRQGAATTKSGEQVAVYYLEPNDITDELQMVMEIHPQVEEIVLPVEIDDLKLP